MNIFSFFFGYKNINEKSLNVRYSYDRYFFVATRLKTRRFL